MLKPLLIGLLAFLIFTPATHAVYERTERLIVESSDETNRNLVLLRNGDRYLIHYKGLCDKPKAGDRVVVSIQNELDSNNDYLKTGTYNKCEIDQAELIDEVFTVTRTYAGKTHVVVKGENEALYTIYFGSFCSAVRGYLNQNVYIQKTGRNLIKGDILFLPRNENRCVLTTVLSVDGEEAISDPTLAEESAAASAESAGTLTVTNTGDIKRPTTPTSVRALPGRGAVYIYWRASTDNVAVDHYIVAYDKFRINTKDLSFDSIPNKMISKTSSFKIENLSDEESYYFYVVAVDTSGNISSDWSFQATATPRRSIRTYTATSFVNLRIFLAEETPFSYLFRWSRPSTVQRQTVILEVDGERDFASPDWRKGYIRISKKAERRGKALTLIVKTFGYNNQSDEDEYEFSFQ